MSDFSYQSGSSDFEIIYNISKKYPTKTKYVVYNKPYIIPDRNVNSSVHSDVSSKASKTKTSSEYQLIDRSLRRAKSEIQDIVLCNPFDMFATFTFNDSTKNTKKFGYTVHDRQNPTELKKVMSNWLKSQQKLHGKFDYIIVAEYHKDGESIHFHAMLNGYKGRLVDSGLKDKGKIIWNIPGYKAGHSTIKMINQTPDDIGRIGSYVTKYITKDMPLFSGKKRYWCSRGFDRPAKSHNETLPSVDLFTNVYETEFYTIYEFPNLQILPVDKLHQQLLAH